ncbi:hypothetical protein BHU09_05735 [Tannerella sp. oral taxon 808]|nr:hypothetical protein BHU09_05735 [Tannerella sp. oral taxon 808]
MVLQRSRGGKLCCGREPFIHTYSRKREKEGDRIIDAFFQGLVTQIIPYPKHKQQDFEHEQCRVSRMPTAFYVLVCLRLRHVLIGRQSMILDLEEKFVL